MPPRKAAFVFRASKSEPLRVERPRATSKSTANFGWAEIRSKRAGDLLPILSTWRTHVQVVDPHLGLRGAGVCWACALARAEQRQPRRSPKQEKTCARRDCTIRRRDIATNPLELRREVAQEWRLVSQLVTANPIATLPDLQNYFDDVIDMALRVGAPRNRQPHQVHLGRAPNISVPISTERIPPSR